MPVVTLCAGSLFLFLRTHQCPCSLAATVTFLQSVITQVTLTVIIAGDHETGHHRGPGFHMQGLVVAQRRSDRPRMRVLREGDILERVPCWKGLGWALTGLPVGAADTGGKTALGLGVRPTRTCKLPTQRSPGFKLMVK